MDDLGICDQARADDAADLWTSMLTEAVTQATPQKRAAGHSNGWFHDNMRPLRAAFQDAQKKLLKQRGKAGFDAAQSRYRQARSAWRHAVRASIADRDHRMAEAAATEQHKVVMSAFKRAQGGHSPNRISSICAGAGQPLPRTHKEALNNLASFFAGISQPVSSPLFDDAYFHEQQQRVRDASSGFFDEPDRDLDLDFSFKTLTDAIHNLPLHKAPGPDGAYNEALRHLPQRAAASLLSIYNFCLRRARAATALSSADRFPPAHRRRFAMQRKGKPC